MYSGSNPSGQVQRPNLPSSICGELCIHNKPSHGEDSDHNPPSDAPHVSTETARNPETITFPRDILSESEILRQLFYQGECLASIRECSRPSPQVSSTFTQILSYLADLPLLVLLSVYPDPYGPRSILGTIYDDPISGETEKAGGVIGFVMIRGGNENSPYCWIVQGLEKTADTVIIIDHDEMQYTFNSKNLSSVEKIFGEVFWEAFDIKSLKNKYVEHTRDRRSYVDDVKTYVQ